VQQVAELPADDGVAGQRQVEGVGPEGGGSALLVRPHDDDGTAAVKEDQKNTDAQTPLERVLQRMNPADVGDPVTFLSCLIHFPTDCQGHSCRHAGFPEDEPYLMYSSCDFTYQQPPQDG